MGVQIVTDSTSDLPQNVIEELGIMVIPLNVHFGQDSYLDGIDMQTDEFYKRLLSGTVLPKTSAPSPGIFKECYEKVFYDRALLIARDHKMILINEGDHPFVGCPQVLEYVNIFYVIITEFISGSSNDQGWTVHSCQAVLTK